MHKLNLYLLAGLCTIGSVSYAQDRDKRFPIGNSSSVLNSFRQQLSTQQQPGSTRRLQLKVSSSLTFPGAIINRSTTGAGEERLIGSIERVPNSSFYLSIEGKAVEGHILMRDSRKAYKYSSDNSGTVFVEETDINNIVCIDYNHANIAAPATAAGNTAAASVAAAAVTDLQSYPGGVGCVLLDFDGQVVSGTLWNNGNTINAAPANLSDADKQNVWELISEDFRPFHLNITTSEAVYNTYPKNKRMRCIFTPTNTAAPGAGGVAYLNSFRWNDDTPCWVFNGGAKAAGEAGSHEVGHTFGLSHDGRTSPKEEYYAGQGTWAPIMGVGYYKSLIQWSKGEYANPSTTQDDLAIIANATNGVGYRADDYGNTISAAASLNVSTTGAVNRAGVIERTGDVDMFSFTTTGGTANLTFTPNALYPNLDIVATVYNSSGAVVISANPTAQNAVINTNLAAGNYYVSVTGTGAGDPLTTGYSNYGSLGTYTITGTVAGGTNPNPTGNAIFYKDCNFGGAYAIGLTAGNYTTAQLVAKGISNKDVSSIKVSSGYEVVLYKNDNFGGAAAGFTADVACLVGNGWNDSASSLRIRSVSNTLPEVSITSPASGSTFSAPAGITINVNASDADGAISKVEFYNGATKLGEDATSPYTYTWSNVGNGTYTIRAVATDDRGGQSTAQLNVVVGSATAATIYKNCDYTGYAINLAVGSYTLNQLIALGAVNDDISSLKVTSGYEVVLYQDNNFTGSAYVFRGDFACLVNVGLSGGTSVNLNDWASSVVVRQTTARATAAIASEAASPLTTNTPSLKLAPNPVSSDLLIQYGNTGEAFGVTIVDINGVAVYNAQRFVSGQHINIAHLKTGLYFVKINNGKETITQKLIKQ